MITQITMLLVHITILVLMNQAVLGTNICDSKQMNTLCYNNM